MTHWNVPLSQLSEAPAATASPISGFLGLLEAHCPAVSSVWMIGERAGSAAPHQPGPLVWDLLVFADAATLQRLRVATHLHRRDVRMRVVTDGDAYAVAWGDLPGYGSLFQWEWLQASDAEAFYSEAHWREPVQARVVTRTRRKALCLWRKRQRDSR
jgi:hypothetical protein